MVLGFTTMEDADEVGVGEKDAIVYRLRRAAAFLRRRKARRRRGGSWRGLRIDVDAGKHTGGYRSGRARVLKNGFFRGPILR